MNNCPECKKKDLQHNMTITVITALIGVYISFTTESTFLKVLGVCITAFFALASAILYDQINTPHEEPKDTAQADS